VIAALVCGRTEKEPFAGRNTFPLFGRPLVAYPLLAATHAREVDRVFLSTNDLALKEIGQYHRAQIIDRPEELAGDAVVLEDVIAHAHDVIRQTSPDTLEALVVLLANSPTVTSGQIDQSVGMLRANRELDAVMSVSAHHEFHPALALKLKADGLVVPYARPRPSVNDEVYFPDALLWALRPSAFFGEARQPVSANEIVDPARHRVRALVHDGYGDVDYPWQIPAVVEWLRHKGFNETRTPYQEPIPRTRVAASPRVPSVQIAARSQAERRVLVTTVPFGEADRRSLELLQNAGAEYVINPLGRRLKEEELVGMVADFGILIAGTEPITARVMDAAPHLRLISRVGVGLDSVDLAAARERKIHVSYTPEAPAPAVAELTVGLMLAVLRGIGEADRNLRSGVWNRFMGRRLATLVVGVIGVGRIGKRVIRILSGGFPGVRILANDLVPDVEFGQQHDVRWVEKDTIYREADVITVHLPLTPLTRRLVSDRELDQMKSTTVLINTARGNLIDERALATRLREKRFAGAAVDVFNSEPYSGELAAIERCLLTCHMGSMSRDCRGQMEIEATEEVVRFLRGQELMSVVPESEYPA
jgi:D-3-phosphoglycerate dehydrogenase / 2-oxoglutarate reductase